MKFSKSLIASATLLAMASAAQAQFKTDGLLEVYGRASFSVDRLDDGASYNRMNLSSNASRLGFKGSKKIGNLTGIWQVETELQPNLGATDTSNNRLASRDTFAGLRGDFGTIRAGKFDTPFKVAREPFNLFGDQLGDMRNLTKVGTATFDERLNNMLEYQTPVMNGFQAKVAHSFHSGVAATNTTAGAEQKLDATSAALGYKAGNLDATLAYETYGADNNTTVGKRDATRAAISYKVTSDLRLAGFYQTADSKGGSTNDSAVVTGVGAEYAVTPSVSLKAHYVNRNADKANADAKMYTLGAEYRYDKALRFYANYASVDNGTSAALTPWKEGRTANAAAGSNGLDKSGLSIGMRYDF
jgi:predicted porin